MTTADIDLAERDHADVIRIYGGKAAEAAAVVSSRAGRPGLKNELIQVGHRWLDDNAAEIIDWPRQYRLDRCKRTAYLDMYSAMRNHLQEHYGIAVAMPPGRY